MENKMEEILKILKINFFEEFIISCNKDIYRFSHNGLERFLLGTNTWVKDTLYLQELLVGKIKISKPLLTTGEREYLEVVLKPYFGSIRSICRYEISGQSCLIMQWKNKYGESKTIFPVVDSLNFFVGLEANKKYTLEELDLYQDFIYKIRSLNENS